jgi:hypothetical protein
VASVNCHLRPFLACVAALAALAVAAPAALGATTFVPNRFDDPLVGGAECTPPAVPNACSLRGAVAAAASGDTVQLAAGTYTLTQNQLSIGQDITITGAGMLATTIKQTGQFRVISSLPPTLVKINSLTVTGGNVVGTNGPNGSSPGMAGSAGGSANSSAIAFAAGLALTDVLVTGNTAVAGNGGKGAQAAPGIGGNGGDGGDAGGALSGAGTLTMLRTEVSGNSSFGGVAGAGADGSGAGSGGVGGTSGPASAAVDMGIGSSLAITDSLIANNIDIPGAAGAGGKGGASGGSGGAGGLGNQPADSGGIFTNGHIDLTNVTITGNYAGGSAGGTGGAAVHSGSSGGAGGASFGGDGGGVALLNGAVGRFDSVTIAANHALTPTAAPGGTGAGAGAAGATGSVVHSTGGDVEVYNSTLSLRDSIVATGQAGDATQLNCAFGGGATFTSLGHNVDDGHSCLAVAAVGDHKDTPGGLQPLAANGGPTATMAVAVGSAAIGGVGGGCVQINGSTPLTHDQRGLPSASPCDIGAWQHQLTAITVGAQVTVGGPGGDTFTCQHATAIGDGPFTHTIVWLRNGAPIAGATGDTYNVTDPDRGQLVACQDTVSTPFGSATSLSDPVTVEVLPPPPPPGGTTATTTPKLSKLSVSPSSARRGHKAHVKFTLNTAAKVTFKLQRKTRGTKSGAKCVKRTGSHRHGASCSRLVSVTGAPKSVSGKSGSNSESWTPSKKLAAGSYVLTATPSHGKAVTKTFTVKSH